MSNSSLARAQGPAEHLAGLREGLEERRHDVRHLRVRDAREDRVQRRGGRVPDLGGVFRPSENVGGTFMPLHSVIGVFSLHIALAVYLPTF